MGRYNIFETNVFIRDCQKCPAGERDKLEQKLMTYIYPQLRVEPHFGTHIRKLRNWRPETWRYRIGNWRCFYEIDERDHMVSMTILERRSERTYSHR